MHFGLPPYIRSGMEIRVTQDGYRQKLLQYMRRFTDQKIMVAFSGGVDSSLLLAAACEAAKEWNGVVYAATVHTRLHPAEDAPAARRVAEETGAEHLVIEIDELEDAGIQNNPVDRCYLCKKYLFTRLQERARECGAAVILEGTNADDLLVYRPGIRAVKELGIMSPLAELGLTKAQVRAAAEEYGISVSNRPSSPCLATRFPYGTVLSYEKMRLVDIGESFLKGFGFYNVRLRVHDDTARIEVDEKDIPILLEHRQDILNRIRELGFAYVTADLAGFRSGSMDETIKV